MTQEDKQLLLVDLCARLPYGIICQMEDDLIINDSPFYDYILSERHIDLFRNHKNFYIKPYLRSMSSMTEGEKNEHFGRIMTIDIVQTSKEVIDFLNAHHFDYRGLIKKGLAIEVTEKNNPYANN